MTEPWDGVRNYQARNVMHSMRKGDQAFFYHSNCKEVWQNLKIVVPSLSRP